MPEVTKILQVYATGPLTVVGFGGKNILDTVNIVECRDEISEIVKSSQCQVLAFDLTGVKLIPSGLLGLLASLRQLNIEVHLYNPSADIRDVLEVTKLDQIMQIHDVEV